MTHAPISRRGFLGLTTGALALGAPSRASIDAPRLLGPEGTEPDTLARAFNSRVLKSPRLRVLCETADHVRRGLEEQDRRRLEMRVLASGHSFEGFSQSDGLVLDLRRMNTVTIDAQRRVARVGAATQIQALNQAAAAHGLVLGTGTCPTVCAVGLAAGAGFGPLARSFGLACDHLLSAEVMLADGRAVTASAEQNPDLFWALRGGGGGTFGVVTSAEFRLNPLPRMFMVTFQFVADVETSARWIADWQQMGVQAPPSLGFYMYAENHQPGHLQINATLYSTAEDRAARQTAQAVARLAKMTAQPVVRVGNYSDVLGSTINEADFVPRRTKFIHALQDRAQTLDEARAFVEAITAGRAMGLRFSMEALGGLAGRASPAATAYPHRAALMVCQVEALVPHAENEAERIAQARLAIAGIGAADTGWRYSNYPDLGEPGWAQAYWGPNLDRLRAVKRRYDPGNLLWHAQSVQP